jgi:hypothetical protein
MAAFARSAHKPNTVFFSAVLVLAATACGQRASSDAGVWLNPMVGDHCAELERVKELEDPGGSLPENFPLPDGASIEGSVAGDPPTVRVVAGGDFRQLDSFFKSQLEDRGWSAGSSGGGSDPGGRFGQVIVKGHGWKGEVLVIQCGDADAEVLVEIEPVRASR